MVLDPPKIYLTINLANSSTLIYSKIGGTTEKPYYCTQCGYMHMRGAIFERHVCFAAAPFHVPQFYTQYPTSLQTVKAGVNKAIAYLAQGGPLRDVKEGIVAWNTLACRLACEYLAHTHQTFPFSLIALFNARAWLLAEIRMAALTPHEALWYWRLAKYTEYSCNCFAIEGHIYNICLDGHHEGDLPINILRHFKRIFGLFLIRQFRRLPNNLFLALRKLRIAFLWINTRGNLLYRTKRGTLSALDLSELNLIELPEYDAKLFASVSELDLSNNRLEDIPYWISDLPSLKFLYLKSNHIEKIDKSILKLRRLKYLDLSANPIKWPPPTIAQNGLYLDKELFELRTYFENYDSLKEPLQVTIAKKISWHITLTREEFYSPLIMERRDFFEAVANKHPSSGVGKRVLKAIRDRGKIPAKANGDLIF